MRNDATSQSLFPITVKNNGGITVGASSTLSVGVEGQAGIISHQTSGSNIDIRVNNNGTTETVMRIDSTSKVGINNLSPDQALDVTGNILPNKEINVRFTIYGNTRNPEYQEIHTTKTDEYGMINLVIGKGNSVAGKFTEIYWDGSTKNLKVEINLDGTYSDLSDQELLFIPYAYHRDIIASGNLTVDGNSLLKGKLDINQDLSVGGNTKISGELTVDDNTLLNSKLTVVGSTTLNKSLSVLDSSSTTLTGSLDVSGDASFKGDLNLDGDLKLKNTLSIEGSNDKFLATINNKDGGEGDGILIKLGRTHSAWNGSGFVSAPMPTTAPYKELLQLMRDLIDGKKKPEELTPLDIVKAAPKSMIAAAAQDITNRITTETVSYTHLTLPTKRIV